ncbi:transketolase C-terminal domain-containing protein [Clostridium sp. AM58-1XD]|uniref:transketolase family protein n=1 Tax=Clostridium sp. AM58-1XD TaxID=2292307 RepID=UPI000E470825|nr:transketolase C-terminal domain-containing protein [Clostridium sp. AM58-1XD]RGY99261.1 transketolase family protein [Clostridium sp. AM58-1XD]
MSYTNQRTAYGNTLVELGSENRNIVVLDADLGGSTMGKMFEEAFPERHFEMGIAEANMTSVAAGLAQSGKIPFTNSFAVFSGGRAFDQIRQTIAIGRLNVKICGSSSGLSDFGDGATHQSVEDMAIMRALPNMTVLCPADANETVEAVKAMAELDGPCYIRLNRNNYPNVTEEGRKFEIGTPSVLRQGEEIAVLATGYMVGLALEAAEQLKDEISVRVINVSTIKPMNPDALKKAVAGCRAIVTAEEHSIVGGLGSAVMEVLRNEPKPAEFVGINDVFGCSSHSYEDVLKYYGLTTERVIEAVRKAAGF